jgi:hypothetical protein
MDDLATQVARAICHADFHEWPKDDYNGRTQRRAYERMASEALLAVAEAGFVIVPKVAK